MFTRHGGSERCRFKGAYTFSEIYTILQILSVTLFEKMPLNQLLSESGHTMEHVDSPNQLILFN